MSSMHWIHWEFSDVGILDQAPYEAASLEFWILGYGVVDCQDQSQDYEDILGIR